MEFALSTADPLAVLASTSHVMANARHVRIDLAAVEQTARSIRDLTPPVPTWGADLHFVGDTWQTAGWVLVLDALNFSFWSDDPSARWRVVWENQIYDGYWALVAALRRAVDEGFTLWDASFLRQIDLTTVAQLLRPTDHRDPQIPMLESRHRHLVELGAGLLALPHQSSEGQDMWPIQALVESAGGSAIRFVQSILVHFPSFRDMTMFDSREIRFLKRAQILAADLSAALVATGYPGFRDLHLLTAFADYKVPQVLRRLGIIDYTPDLSAVIDAGVHLLPGSREEVEIRAATIWAVELIRRALTALGQPMSACEIDWALWQAGQTMSTRDRPYHRTRTIYY